MRPFFLFFLLLVVLNAPAQLSRFFPNNKTLTYEQTIEAYEKLDKQYKEGQLLEYGTTDIGKPLHLFVISTGKEKTPEEIRKANKRVLLINNGIHPGEPCGVDASLKLAEDLLANKMEIGEWLQNTVVCIIPMYNIGGALNRGCCSRANQNGPEEYGFRGNAKNLDLNRDFIKLDSENAKTFTKIYHHWKPDVFIDTHTSNGADYPYVMTLIRSQKDKVHPTISAYVEKKMLPYLYKKMKWYEYEMCPYVNPIDKIPDNGIYDFMESPRYSTGYTSLFNTISFTTEAHMFKPFKDRVLATYVFFRSVLEFTNENAEKISQVRAEANKWTAQQRLYALEWVLDTARYSKLKFNGYEAKTKPSAITGEERLYYDTDAPFTKKIKHYTTYEAKILVDGPKYYVIPQAWKEVIHRLELNDIEMKRLRKDTVLSVQVYYIDGYDTGKRPYESHYAHHSVELRKDEQSIAYRKGDYVVPINQRGNRFIVKALEPQGVDSYFTWNFFDAILQQKEWYSSYVFEDKAAELLKKDPALKEKFEKRKINDEEFAISPRAQLYFLYRNSSYYEPSHNRYPVARINEVMSLPVE